MRVFDCPVMVSDDDSVTDVSDQVYALSGKVKLATRLRSFGIDPAPLSGFSIDQVQNELSRLIPKSFNIVF